jgi:hypothetical protein
MERELEVLLVKNLLDHPAAYDVDIEGTLWVRRYEYPMWAVEWEAPIEPKQINESLVKTKTEVKEFNSTLEAAIFFVNKRHEMKLGLDYWFPNE